MMDLAIFILAIILPLLLICKGATSFEILEGSTFRLDGNVVNKCKSYGELGILIFLIGFLGFSVVSAAGNEMLPGIFIFSAVIIWVAVDVYRRPFKALNFIRHSLNQLEQINIKTLIRTSTKFMAGYHFQISGILIFYCLTKRYFEEHN